MAASRPSDRGYYVYAVTRAKDVAVPAGAAGVDPRFPVRVLEHGGLAAIVSEVRLDEFGEEEFEENVRRLGWLEEKAFAHERVVDLALNGGALLPLRFATIFASEDHVRDMLDRERAAFAAVLRRVDGKREWGVKALVSHEQVAAALQATGEAAALRRDAEDVEGGRSYFARKQLERLLAQEVARTTAAWAQKAHERLAACASDVRLNPPQPSELSGHAEDVVLNGAYLVAREREGELREAVAALEREHADSGMTFVLTGPWPAYNFVTTPGESGWKTS